MSLLQVIPGFHPYGIGSRKHRQTVGSLHALHKHFNFITRLYGNLALLRKLSRVDYSFRLVAEINDNSPFTNSDNRTADYLAFLQGSLFLLKLVKQLSEV